jgi:hypothetical protein
MVGLVAWLTGQWRCLEDIPAGTLLTEDDIRSRQHLFRPGRWVSVQLVTGLPADSAGSSGTTGKPHMQEVPMATTKQTKAARRNVTRAQKAAASKQTIAHMPKQTRTALGKQGAAVAQRKRTGSDSPKTRAELYEIAKRRDLPGRSKMGRDELARKLGEK